LRKTLSFLLILTLTCGLYACGSGKSGSKGTTYKPKYNGEEIQVQRREVAKSKKITFQGFLDMLERKQKSEWIPLANSYIVSREQSYQNHWYRVVYYAYPQFTDEMKGGGAKQIKRYYKEQYKNSGALDDFPWIEDAGKLVDSTEQIVYYRMQLYTTDIMVQYVAVNFIEEEHTGGSQIKQAPRADVFDRNTGTKLRLGDVVDLKKSAKGINKAVADHLRIKDIKPSEAYDITAVENPSFSVNNDGLVMLFAPGDLAPEAYGMIQAPVPWAAVTETAK